eukprot:3067230-Prymnesium_polylepis.1
MPFWRALASGAFGCDPPGVVLLTARRPGRDGRARDSNACAPKSDFSDSVTSCKYALNYGRT